MYTKLNYTNATLDTTTWIDIEPYDEIAFLLRSTDSAAFDVYFDGRNSYFPNTRGYTTYTDSVTVVDTVSGGQNTGERRNILIKTTTLNRLNQPGNNQVRIRLDHRAAGAGTTSGRYFYVELIKKN